MIRLRPFVSIAASVFVVVLSATARGQGAPKGALQSSADDRSRCKAGDLAGCVRDETARCDAGDARACGDLAGRYNVGVIVPRDQPRGQQLSLRAFHLADSSCSLGNLDGCAFAGLVYAAGVLVPADSVRDALYDIACTGGNGSGCKISRSTISSSGA